MFKDPSRCAAPGRAPTLDPSDGSEDAMMQASIRRKSSLLLRIYFLGAMNPSESLTERSNATPHPPVHAPHRQ